jgi:hypothetical protein
MNRKMLIAIAIVELLLVGTLVAIGSGKSDYMDTTNEATDDNCVGDCDNCDGQCKGSEECTSQGKGICDGTGLCSQNRQMTKNCNSECDGSGSCSQNTIRIRSCNSGSGCSGSCLN